MSVLRLANHAWVLVPLASFAIALALFKVVLSPALETAPDPFAVVLAQPGDDKAVASFAELEGRLTWAAVAVLFGLSTLFMATTLAGVTWRLRRRIRYAGVTVGVTAAATGGGAWLGARSDYPFNEVLLAPVMELLSVADPVIAVIEAAGVAALAALAVAAMLVLVDLSRALREAQRDDDDDWAAPQVRELVGHQRLLRSLLYAGAFMLVAGALHAAALYSWAGSVVRPGLERVEVRVAEVVRDSLTGEAVRDSLTGKRSILWKLDSDPRPGAYADTARYPTHVAYFDRAGDLATAMGAANGMFYSLLLGAIFAPALLAVRSQSLRLAQKANPGKGPKEIDAWVADQVLETGLMAQAVPLLSALAPAIFGGPVVALLEFIVS